MSERAPGARAWSGRTPRAVVAGMVLACALTGCGDDMDDYCAALADEERGLTELSERSAARQGDVLTPTLAAFQRLREAAPDELVDEWETVVFAYQDLADAVERAGVDPKTYRPGRRPPGVSKAEAQDLAAVAAKLSSIRVVEAISGIEEHAAEVCDVEFGG